MTQEHVNQVDVHYLKERLLTVEADLLDQGGAIDALEARIDQLEAEARGTAQWRDTAHKRLITVEGLANDLLNVCTMFQQALDRLVPIFDTIHEKLNVHDEAILSLEVGAGNLAASERPQVQL